MASPLSSQTPSLSEEELIASPRKLGLCISTRRERNLTFRKNDFVIVEVGDPITHNTWEHGRYSTYQLKIQTNSIVFTLAESCVRRRYSEFVWLRQHLKKHHYGIVPPELPPKVCFCGRRFSKEVLRTRTEGLADFLSNVFEERLYLSDSHLHLFLQTQLSTAEITSSVKAGSGVNVADIILDVRDKTLKSRITCIEDGLLGLPPAVREAVLAQSPVQPCSFSEVSPEGSSLVACQSNRLEIPEVRVTDTNSTDYDESAHQSSKSGSVDRDWKIVSVTSSPVIGILKAVPSIFNRNSRTLPGGHFDRDSGCSVEEDSGTISESDSPSLDILKSHRSRRVTFSDEVLATKVQIN